MPREAGCPVSRLPTARGGLFDPPSELALLRQTHPVERVSYPDGRRGWLITSYAIGRAVLGDSRFGKELDGPTFLHRVDDTPRDPALATFDRVMLAGNMLRMDPPDHTRFRRLLAPKFTHRAICEFEQRLDAIMMTQLDSLAYAGPPADLVSAFCFPVSLSSIGCLLGIPDSELGLLNPQPPLDADAERVVWAVDIEQLFRELIARKRAKPVDDVLSHIATSEEFDDDEKIGVSITLALAGFHTSAVTLGYAFLALLANARLWESVVECSVTVEAVVEELLRYLTPNQFDAHARIALQDVEVGGMSIMAGERVHVSAPAANRDSGRFAEPDLIDFHRDARGHLTFGHGIHICIGQHLARVEMQSAVHHCRRRLPTLRLATTPPELPMAPEPAPLAGPLQLPVSW